MKSFCFLILMLFAFSHALAQETPELYVAVDTTTVKIGARLNYTLQVKADSTAQVIFAERPNFIPFEVIDESLIDTSRTQSGYLFAKRYALIRFDSGHYWIPRQQVFVNGVSKTSDSILIRVENVVVDTLKQKLYDIKPIVLVKKNYDALIGFILWGLVIAILLIGSMFGYLFQKRRRKLRDRQLSPFERVIVELKALEAVRPSVQDEYKEFYSKLTNVVRHYLEEEAKIDALESTSEEVVLKLEMLRDSGKLKLKSETLKDLKSVLQTADLVKFARSVPEHGSAAKDRNKVESVVIETKEGLPEPTEEELREKAAYREKLAKKQRQEQIVWALSGVVILSILGLITSMAIYGYYPVRDTLLGHPTKKLYSGDWIKSQYGTPPIRIETPEVLQRIPTGNPIEHEFAFGDFDSPFYINLFFSIQPRKQGFKDPSGEKMDKEGKDDARAQALLESIISRFESKGAVNILIKDEQITLPSGLPIVKIYGTLDYPKKGEKSHVRCNYSTLLFGFEEGTIMITIMYEKDDRYGSQIEERIIKSVDLIKEL